MSARTQNLQLPRLYNTDKKHTDVFMTGSIATIPPTYRSNLPVALCKRMKAASSPVMYTRLCTLRSFTVGLVEAAFCKIMSISCY